MITKNNITEFYEKYRKNLEMEDFLNGNLDNMIDSLTAAHMAEKLKGNEEE